MTNTGLINNVARFSLFVFLTNSPSFILFFELHFYSHHGFIKCADCWPCYYKNFRIIHSCIIPFYFFLSIIYAFLFYKLKLFRGFDSKTIKRWLLSIAIMYGVSVSMYTIVVFSRGVYFGRWYAWILFMPVEFLLKLTSGKYGEVTLLLAIVTTFSTWLYRRFWMHTKASRKNVEINIDFLLLAFLFSILLFCTVTASYEMTYHGRFDGTGYGFPFVWYVKEVPLQDLNQHTYVYLNNLIFDFIIYFLVVNFIFWGTLTFRGSRVYLIEARPSQFYTLTTIAILVLFVFSRNFVFPGLTFLNLDYEPVFHTMKLHIGP